MEDLESNAWRSANVDDLWIFDKLIVSRKLGYVCGPAGVDVPSPDHYIVRPCVNIPGMGRDAVFQFIEEDTRHLPSGHFWCEIFKGDHVSVDYLYGKQVLAVKGTRDSDLLYKFNAWGKINQIFPIPIALYSLIKNYKYINIEYIGGRAIEVHLRCNPDFIHGNSVAYPVWNDTTEEENNYFKSKGLRFIEAPDYYRKGFWVD